jgi:heme exporter protein A
LKSPLRLVVDDLACSRGERLLFGGLSLSVAGGEALLVTGANGVGKTTLLRLIAGFIKPDQGSIRLEDAKGEGELPSSLHYLGHRDGLKAALTTRENLALAPMLLNGDGLPLEQAAERLKLVPLLDLPVAVLSAGQRRRTALARLLMVDRSVWLLDEPTAALDAASSGIVSELIAEHVGKGKIVLAATHLALGVTARELVFDANGAFQMRAAA